MQSDAILDDDPDRFVLSSETQLLVLQAARTREYRRSRVLVVLIPIVTALAQILANNIAAESQTYFVAQITRAVTDSIITVMGLQILVWWAWRDPSHRMQQHGITLLLLMTLGMVLSATVERLDDTYLGRWGRLPYGVAIVSLIAFGWTKLFTTFMAILTAGAIIRYRFVDRCHPASHGIPARMTWSIRGMFAGTLAAALLLAVLQWLRNVYSGVIPDAYYPSSDLAYVIWITLGIVSDVLCLYAAACLRSGRRILEAFFLMAIATVLVLLAYGAYWSFVPGQQSLSINRVVLPVVISIMLMTGLHWWLLRRWRRAGHDLRRQTGYQAVTPDLEQR